MTERKMEVKRGEIYLETNELCERIKYKAGTISNLVSKGELVEGIHFIKPTPKKRLFIWSRMEVWLWRRSPGCPNDYDDDLAA